ncbi:response regulator [Pedobacter alluvionis]|uniref:DNA-binding NarL/FixJ family response regulator n=1 Tax=Pedobacter alluvionis TaxID=475253 RepID=A0A497XY95_9SPHI|nr:response regulator [Pedobacter alluvionis]RLJ73707.1 DNA-binding NarL/FixJ family response regulator [Pedobacter alluvionis]TFB32671.1 response regulator transcription factor [Pedobacter alluvionis]
MFKRILIAEDQETQNISLQKTLAEMGVEKPEYVYYCDDALTWIKNAVREGRPYDLLITDLYFEEDHNPQKIEGGAELIKAAKEVQPNLKTLVFSGENRPAVIDMLFKEMYIDGYVRKARHDGQYLRLAISAIHNHKKYLSPDLKQARKENNSHDFTDLDIAIISQLVEGIPQKNIPYYLQENNIKPSGLSSIEKRLNLMKEVLGFSKNEQLVAYCKDSGII